ncbi:MAG: AsnC family protein [Magnetococcales bacterium]|nr:AsnC family protein [Magnetococcales bacterium]
MTLLVEDLQQVCLIEAIQGGFPLCNRPFREIGTQIGLTEAEVIGMLADLQARGVIKRMGIVVRHHELGYRSNAMVVWDVPDGQAAGIGHRITAFDFISLCYRRRRALPGWPYNLYCMIHGRQRDEVNDQIRRLMVDCRLEPFPHKVLFSNRRFKQRGAFYVAPGTTCEV